MLLRISVTLTFDYIEEKEVCKCNNWIRTVTVISKSQSNVCFKLKDLFNNNPIALERKHTSLRIGYTNYVCSLFTCKDFEPALKVYTKSNKGEIFYSPIIYHSDYNKTFIRQIKANRVHVKAKCISLEKSLIDNNTFKINFNEEIIKKIKFKPIIIDIKNSKEIIVFSILSFIFIVMITAFMFLTRENRIGFRLFAVRVYPNFNNTGEN